MTANTCPTCGKKLIWVDASGVSGPMCPTPELHGTGHVQSEAKRPGDFEWEPHTVAELEKMYPPHIAKATSELYYCDRIGDVTYARSCSLGCVHKPIAARATPEEAANVSEQSVVTQSNDTIRGILEQVMEPYGGSKLLTYRELHTPPNYTDHFLIAALETAIVAALLAELQALASSNNWRIQLEDRIAALSKAGKDE